MPAKARSTNVQEAATMVAVLEADPELGADLEQTAFAHARREALAPLIELGPGPWTWTAPRPDSGGRSGTGPQPGSAPRSGTTARSGATARSDATARSGVRGHLGLFVLGGLLTRSETVGELHYTEFLGSGDVLRPWLDAHHGGPARASWNVVVPARIAVLDYDFALRTCRWPEIPAALLDRAVMRSRSLGVTLAIHRAVRIQDRVLMMLWHLAHRWGHVTGRGTVLPVPLTHEALAQLVGARRSPVTIAVGELARQGALQRGPGRSWLLHGDPQQWLQSDAGDELALASQ
jgi:hypothetical protein